MLDMRNRLAATVPPPSPPPPALTSTVPPGGHCTTPPQHVAVTSNEQPSAAVADPTVTPTPSADTSNAGSAAPAPAQASSSSSATRVTGNTRESTEPEISSPAEAAVRPVRPANNAHPVSAGSGSPSAPARPQQDRLSCEGHEQLHTDIEHVRSTTQHHLMLQQLLMPKIEAFGNDLAPFLELQRMMQAYAKWLPDLQTAVGKRAAQQHFR